MTRRGKLQLPVVLQQQLLLLAAAAASGCEGAAAADFPLMWDIGGAGLNDLDLPELVKATPRVQLHKIIECPHPCGLLPSIGCVPATAEYGCNGELPQGPDFNLTLHLDTLQKTLDKSVPVGDDRWMDLDFESWSPIWDRTGAAYQNASIALAKKAHPSWAAPQLLAEATKEWEAAAMKLLVETMRFVRKIRPQLKIAMYCYPLREYYNGYNTSSVSICVQR